MTCSLAQGLAHLALERARLLEQLIGLEEEALTRRPMPGGWTVKDLLVHIAAWDRWERREMERTLTEGAPDLSALETMDAFNADAVAAWRGRDLDEVLAELQEARRDWTTWLAALPVETFCQERTFRGVDWTFPTILQVQAQHDAEHAAQVAAWRRQEGLWYEVWPRRGSKAVLLAALAASREALLTAVALVPPEERASRPVCGTWTLKDVLGHVTDWEALCLQGLGQMAVGRPPQVEAIEDVDAWNQVHVEARRDQPWEEVWAELEAVRRALTGVLEGMDEDAMGRAFPAPWDPHCTPYDWAYICLTHEREHASPFNPLP